MLNILRERLIRIREAGGARRRVTLPELYEGLGRDSVETIDAVRPHQAHAWHATLAQLGALALRASGETAFDGSAERWAERLRKLTGREAGENAWELVVPTSSRAALLQPPSPNGLAEYRRKTDSPDTIDVTITTKAHDIKPDTANEPEPDDWLSVLISAQTQGGYEGGHTYGVMRMNSGTGTRGCLGLAPAEGAMGAHVGFDVERMLATRVDELRRALPIATADEPLGLGWLRPWDGEQQLGLEDIDLWHVECCRRLRLVIEDGRIVAYHRGVKRRRIDAESRRGVVGDFWTVVDMKEGKAAPIAWRTRYDRLWPLLADRARYAVSGSMRVPDALDSELRIIIRGLARQQGKTRGYRERCEIRLPASAARALASGEPHARNTGDGIAADAANIIGALRSAAVTANASGAETRTLSAERREHLRRVTTAAVTELEQYIDTRFFASLTRRLAGPDEAAAEAIEFARRAVAQGQRILNNAIRQATGSKRLRGRSGANARRQYLGILRSEKSTLADRPEIFGKQVANG